MSVAMSRQRDEEQRTIERLKGALRSNVPAVLQAALREALLILEGRPTAIVMSPNDPERESLLATHCRSLYQAPHLMTVLISFDHMSIRFSAVATDVTCIHFPQPLLEDGSEER